MYAVFIVVGLVRISFYGPVIEQHPPGGRIAIVELMMLYAPDERAQEKGGYGEAGY